MHNRLDELIPHSVQSGFIGTLRDHFTTRDADPGLIEFKTFEETGAIQEHAGFGKHASEAKDLQLAFLKRLFSLGGDD